jgi:raffinose/stachyose/melibiose transport system substrate-binding protein
MRKVAMKIASALLITAFLFTSCASPKNESSTNAGSSEAKLEGNVKLTVINGGDTERVAFDEILSKFEKETGVKTQQEVLPDDNDYENIIKTRFATNDMPDIFYYYSGTVEYISLKASSNLVDVTNEPFVNNLTDEIKSYQTVDSKIYGCPWGTYNAMGIYYNINLFKKYDINVPNNYEEFIDICKTLKAKGITPICEAGSDAWPTQIFTLCGFSSIINPTIGGSTGIQKLCNNQLKLKDISALKDVMTRYYNLNKDGYMNTDISSTTYTTQEERLSTGKAAMAFEADWILPDIEDKYENVNDIGYFPLPSDTGKGVAALYPPKQLFISKNSKNVNNAIALEKFMTKTENLNIWYKHNPGITVYKNATSTLYTAQKQIEDCISANQCDIQIQLKLKAKFNDFDKICQKLILNGNVDESIKTLNDNYIKDGQDKQVSGF